MIGVELSERAIYDFFTENKYDFQRDKHDKVTIFTSENITLICADLFDLPKIYYQQATAVYDRAALVALPTDLRNHYVALMRDVFAKRANILLITLDRNRTEVNAPPFNVDEAMVRGLYGGRDGFEIHRLAVHHHVNMDKMGTSTYQRHLIFSLC